MNCEPVGLSDRALRYLRCRPSGRAAPAVEFDTTGSSPEGLDLATLCRVAEGYEQVYGGRTLDIAGGQLAGSMRLGCGASPRAVRSRNGVAMFVAADHETAQCAVMLSEDGVLGSSWTYEFNPLFDSVAHFVEDCAIWDGLRGWSRLPGTDGDFDHVADLIVGGIREAVDLGDSVSWRIGDGAAVAAHPWLTRRECRRISVVLRDRNRVPEACEVLRANGIRVFGDPRRFARLGR